MNRLKRRAWPALHDLKSFVGAYLKLPLLLPLAIYLPITVICAILGIRHSGWLALAGFAAGLYFWTLLEYGMHRFLLHEKRASRSLQKLAAFSHGMHHQHPLDRGWLIISPLGSIPLAILFYLFFWILFGPARDSVFAGLIFGYLCYDGAHFAFHQLPLRSKLFAALKAYHFNHHFRSPNRAYGVTSPLWDWIFKTRPKSSNASTIPSMRVSS